MEITISGKNEYPMVVDVGENKKLPYDKQFKIILKKLNISIHAGEWTVFDANGSGKVNNSDRIRAHVVRIENPVTLNINGKKRPIEVDDLFNDDNHELFFITRQISDKINKLEVDSSNSKKK